MIAVFAGIRNENDFYSHHYLSELFANGINAASACHSPYTTFYPNHGRPMTRAIVTAPYGAMPPFNPDPHKKPNGNCRQASGRTSI